MHRRFAFLAPLGLLTALALPAPATAQVEVRVSLPAIHFEVAPALVVVAPGIRVVPDHAQEIFFVNGHYWMRHEGHWYRARDHRHPEWKKWKKQRVPPGLRKLPPGKYRHYKAMKKAEHAREKRRHEAAKERQKDRKDARKAHEAKGHGKGHGKGRKH